MNQYTSIFTPGIIPIRGRADADARVAVTTTVGGASTTYMPNRSGQDFSIDIPVDNSQGAVTAAVQVDALRHDGTLDIDLHRRLSGDYTVPAATPEVPTYDLDGNMLSHDGWICVWNAQDRLVSATKGDVRLEFSYDYLGRRFEKKVYESNALVRHQLFVYDGFKQIAEYDALDSNALANTYLWQPVGLDVPLLRNGSEFCVSDANKNIVALIDTTGSVTDTYIYDPFGNCAHTGTSTNPFRFSSEYFDEETGLVYYNYRYYSPKIGRWLSRDPLGTSVEKFEYIFSENSVQNATDFLGLISFHEAKKILRALFWGDDIVDTPLRPDTKRYHDVMRQFNMWYEKEYSILYEMDGSLKSDSWINEIYSEKKLCPKNISFILGYPVKPPNDGYFDSANWYSPERINTQRFHTNAVYEMRSKATKSGHANQCIYDCNGNILWALHEDDASPGSADYSSNNVDKSGHLWNDLNPFIWAAQLDGNVVTRLGGKVVTVGGYIRKYYKVRPILVRQ